ncbi:hypothetical protein HALDL1_05420 [Halobacterium sp. DL1]|jgi:hypothetical protein|nr:hypothetical protein HALDL1_05420 [Halobacterium sp. DL1]
MTRDRTVLLAGLGGVGYEALQILCGDPVVDEVVATDVLAGVGQTRTNTARYQALQRGRNPNVEFETLDLLDVDATAALLEDVEPDVVLTAATLLRYSPFEELPDEQREKLIGFTSTGPGYACIVPGQIPLAYNLLRATEKADVREPAVVNVSMPDVVNPALAGAGYEPLVGSGNVGHLVPPIERVASEIYDVPMPAVSAYVVAGHSIIHPMLFYGHTGDVPFYVKVLVDGKDVTEEIDLDAEFQSRNLPFPSEPSAREISIMTGTHSARIVRAVLSDAGTLTHAPGPNGMEGGYPVRLDRDGATVVLPDGISLQEAEALNRESLRYDGVQRIESDGTIVFTDTARDAMGDVLGVDVPRVHPDDALDVTAEIIQGYRDVAADCGIEPKLSVHW